MQNKKMKGSDEVFTQSSIVKFILNEVQFNSCNDLRDIALLEPSAGEGSFVIEILRRLFCPLKNMTLTLLVLLIKT